MLLPPCLLIIMLIFLIDVCFLHYCVIVFFIVYHPESCFVRWWPYSMMNEWITINYMFPGIVSCGLRISLPIPAVTFGFLSRAVINNFEAQTIYKHFCMTVWISQILCILYEMPNAQLADATSMKNWQQHPKYLIFSHFAFRKVVVSATNHVNGYHWN